MKTINADIKANNFKPIYLLYGEEDYLKKQMKDRLKEAMVGDDTMNVTIISEKLKNLSLIHISEPTRPY